VYGIGFGACDFKSKQFQEIVIMKAANVRDAYQQSEAQAKIHPVKLIQLMYERLLVHLEIAEGGILQKDAKLRGENLGRAIALVTELYASIKDDDESEAAGFLRGLYSSILVELPRAGLTNDVEVVRTAIRYIQRLKEIWEETAVVEAGLNKGVKGEAAAKDSGNKRPVLPENQTRQGGGKRYGTEGMALAHLSVSI